jgi:TonB family protein
MASSLTWIGPRRLSFGLGLAALAARLPAETLDELAAAARGGSAEAQLNVALAYDESPGAQNGGKAAEWYRQAAAQGSALAELQLGLFAETGIGQPVDYLAARNHYTAALAGGAPGAALRLALLQLEGWGQPRNPAAAAQQIQAAAEAGDREAEQILAGMYFAGWPVTHDLEFAAVWQQRATEADLAAGSDPESAAARVRRRDHAADLVHTWYELSAKDDYRSGLVATVLDLTRSDADPGQVTLATEWLSNAAASGDRQAEWLLACLYALSPRYFGQVDFQVQARALLADATAAGSYDAARILETERSPHTLGQAARFGLSPYTRDVPPLGPAATSGDVPPAPIRQVQPMYPWDMRVGRQEARVLVDFVVDPQGRTRHVFAVKPDQGEFSQWAVRAVQEWRFRPGRRAGRLVYVHMQVPIIFSVGQNPSPSVPPEPPSHPAS